MTTSTTAQDLFNLLVKIFQSPFVPTWEKNGLSFTINSMGSNEPLYWIDVSRIDDPTSGDNFSFSANGLEGLRKVTHGEIVPGFPNPDRFFLEELPAEERTTVHEARLQAFLLFLTRHLPE